MNGKCQINILLHYFIQSKNDQRDICEHFYFDHRSDQRDILTAYFNIKMINTTFVCILK
jgi:hypothetical protein